MNDATIKLFLDTKASEENVKKLDKGVFDLGERLKKIATEDFVGKLAPAAHLEPAVASMKKMEVNTSAASRAFLEFSRGIEDFSVAGPLGVLNNIPTTFQAIGQAMNLSKAAVGGWTAAVSLGATAAFLLYRNWDSVVKLFDGGATEDQAKRVEALAEHTKEAADQAKRFREELAKAQSPGEAEITKTIKEGVGPLLAQKFQIATQLHLQGARTAEQQAKLEHDQAKAEFQKQLGGLLKAISPAEYERHIFNLLAPHRANIARAIERDIQASVRLVDEALVQGSEKAVRDVAAQTTDPVVRAKLQAVIQKIDKIGKGMEQAQFAKAVQENVDAINRQLQATNDKALQAAQKVQAQTAKQQAAQAAMEGEAEAGAPTAEQEAADMFAEFGIDLGLGGPGMPANAREQRRRGRRRARREARRFTELALPRQNIDPFAEQPPLEQEFIKPPPLRGRRLRRRRGPMTPSEALMEQPFSFPEGMNPPPTVVGPGRPAGVHVTPQEAEWLPQLQAREAAAERERNLSEGRFIGEQMQQRIQQQREENRRSLQRNPARGAGNAAAGAAGVDAGAVQVGAAAAQTIDLFSKRLAYAEDVLNQRGSSIDTMPGMTPYSRT